jgi:hypothetical protein
MIASLIGITTLAAVGLGWYGHKASARIATWGQNLNEQDSIFQAMAEPAERGDIQTGRAISRGSVGSLQAVAGHLSVGASLK